MLTSPSDPFGALLKVFRKRRHLTQQQLAEAIGLHRNTIGRWEEGSFLPESKTLVLELAPHLGLDEHEASQLLEASLLAPAPVWSVPSPRNPFFTGREETLAALHAHLCPGQQVALTPSYALHGLGGIGKTQLALEYAYRYTLAYHAIFWIAAETVEQIHASLLRIAERLTLPECTASDQQRIVTAVQRWLETHGEWLLIWDNLEDLKLLQRFLPSLRQGALLITTRRQAFGTMAHGIELLPMAEVEGMLLLLRRAKILGATATSKQVRELAVSRPAEYAAASELVTRLGGLPLALDQAGAYIEETQCHLTEYLALFRRFPLRLLQERGVHTEHPASVVTTFALAFEQVRQDPAAAELLIVCCFLAPEEIPESLFTQHAPLFSPELQQKLAEQFTFLEIMKKLLAYALIQRHPDRQMLVVHRLVQAVLRERMSMQEQLTWRKRILSILNTAFPEVTFDGTSEFWNQCECLLPHIIEGAGTFPEHAENQKIAQVLQKVANYQIERGRYAQAEPLCLRALRIRERVLGPVHLLVADSLTSLALLFWRQGRYEQAEPLYQRVLSIQEQEVGPEHPLIGRSLNNLAIIYLQQGKYEQAKPLFQRACAIREQALGAEHPLVARPLTNLAIIYANQGHYEQAQALYQRVLRIDEQALGPDHPEVAYTLTGLAELYSVQGFYDRAEPLFQRALTLREQVLGQQHPLVTHPLTNLATIYLEQGKHGQAEQFFLRVLQIWEKAGEPEHPNRAYPLTGLAILYSKQRKYEEAESLFQQALTLRERHLGQFHPETAQTLHDLATCLQQRGRLNEAASLARRALSIRSVRLGDAHPKTVAAQALATQLLEEQARAQTENLETIAPQ